MYSAKDYLLIECKSVRDVLHETLKYEYGASGSREFFEECSARLEYVKTTLEAANDADHPSIRNCAELLIELSALVARIERSSLGEYSWPFVDELKKIADVICTEKTVFGDHTLPKIHVLSDGGLDKYQIYPEQKRPGVHTRRILTIIFPRSLKHFVLLHPVLGHELGHAVWQGSEHEQEFRAIIDRFIASCPTIQDATATAKWLYSPNAPQSVKDHLAFLAARHNIDEINFFGKAADWFAWKEEIACDLIGLMTFGPSFVGALCQLLYSLDPSGNGIGPYHPLVGWRINLITTAAKRLKFDQCLDAPVAPIADATNFWQQLDAFRKADPWFDIAPDSSIDTCTQELAAFLSNHAPARYESPSSSTLQGLLRKLENHVPPVGFEVRGDGSPQLEGVDFRHILYAGWIASRNIKTIGFSDINRLCEHAIMQQRAIDIYRNQ